MTDHISAWPLDKYAPYRTRATANITPFTFYDGVTFLEILERLRQWLNGSLIPGIDEIIGTVNEIIDAALEELDDKLAELNVKLDEVHALITQLSAMIDDVDGKLDLAIDLVETAQAYADRAEDAALRAEEIATLLAGADVMFGENFDPTGETVSSADALNELLVFPAAPQRKYDRLIIPPGVYKFTDTIVVDCFRRGLYAPWGGVTFDFRELPLDGRPAIHLTSSGAPPISGEWGNEPVNSVQLENIRIQGPGSVGGNVGIWAHSPSGAGRVNGRIHNCSIRSFSDGVLFGDHAYMLTFDHVNMHRCGNGYHMPTGTDDTGERITVMNSVIAASGGCVFNEGGMRFHMLNNSFDHNDWVFYQSGNGEIIARDCHFEGYVARTITQWFRMTAGNMLIDGGIMTGSYTLHGGQRADSPTKVNMAYNSTDPLSSQMMIFNNIRMTGIRTTSGFFSGGGGRTLVKALGVGTGGNSDQMCWWPCSALLLPANGGFEQSNILSDVIFVNGDTETQTEVNTSTTINGSNVEAYRTTARSHDGSYSLRVGKLGEGNAAITIAIPIEDRSSIVNSAIRYGRDGSSTGNLVIRHRYGTIRPLNDARSWGIARVVDERTTAVSDTGDAWGVSMTSNIATRPPFWATHVLITAELNAMSAGAVVYLDDLRVGQM